MNHIQPSFNNPYKSTSVHPGASKLPTRKEKANQLLVDILPPALSLGSKVATSPQKKGAGARATDSIHESSASSTDLSRIKDPCVGNNSSLASWGGLVEGLMGITDLAINWGRSTPARGAASGSSVGAVIGTFFSPGIGTAIGAAVGAVAGGLIGSIKTGKHIDQKVRDAVRDGLLERGVLTSDYTIALADGSRFNIGIDGGPKKELGGRRPFEVDTNNPLAKYAISWMNPIFALVSQGNEKIHTDFVGYFANAALSNAKNLDDVRDNVNAIMKQLGLTDRIVAEATRQAAEAGLIDEPVAAAWLNGISERTTRDFGGDLSSKAPDGAVFRASSPLFTPEPITPEIADDEGLEE